MIRNRCKDLSRPFVPGVCRRVIHIVPILLRRDLTNAKYVKNKTRGSLIRLRYDIPAANVRVVEKSALLSARRLEGVKLAGSSLFVARFRRHANQFKSTRPSGVVPVSPAQECRLT